MSWPYLAPLSPLVKALTSGRNWFYNQGFLDLVRMPVPVISVGNLSVGGTGKTPMILFLTQTVGRSFRRPAILTRSYRGKLDVPAEVQLSSGGALLYGDEAVELAEKAQALVFSGPCKWQTAIHAWQVEKPDIFFVDDGFQHRRLHRDFDLVLLDATDEQFEIVPKGRFREPLTSLSRADAVVLTKVNLATAEQVQSWLTRIRETREDLALPAVPTFIARYELAGQSSRPQILTELAGESQVPVALACGLARNDLFQRQVETELARKINQVWAERDHHPWSEREVSAMQTWLAQNPGGIILTTHKDETKLRSLFQARSLDRSLVVLNIQVNCVPEQVDDGESLQALILRVLKTRGWTPGDTHGDFPEVESGPWPL